MLNCNGAICLPFLDCWPTLKWDEALYVLRKSEGLTSCYSIIIKYYEQNAVVNISLSLLLLCLSLKVESQGRPMSIFIKGNISSEPCAYAINFNVPYFFLPWNWQFFSFVSRTQVLDIFDHQCSNRHGYLIAFHYFILPEDGKKRGRGRKFLCSQEIYLFLFIQHFFGHICCCNSEIFIFIFVCFV